MPKRKSRQPRDFYSVFEEDDVHVQLTGQGMMRAIAESKEAWRIANEALDTARERVRRRRRKKSRDA